MIVTERAEIAAKEIASRFCGKGAGFADVYAIAEIIQQACDDHFDDIIADGEGS